MKQKFILCLFFLSIVGHTHAMKPKRKSSSVIERQRTNPVPRLDLEAVISKNDLQQMYKLGVSPRDYTHQQIARIILNQRYHSDLLQEDYKKALVFKRKSPSQKIKSPLSRVKCQS